MEREGELDNKSDVSAVAVAPSPSVSLTDRPGGGVEDAAEASTATAAVAPAVSGSSNNSSSPHSASGGGGGGGGVSNEKALMKRTLLAQSKKIQQLTAKLDGMEAERGALRQQVSDGFGCVLYSTQR